MIDYTLTDEYLEAVQVNEGTWLGLDIGRAYPPHLQQLYAVNKAAAIEFNSNAWGSLGNPGALLIPRTDDEIQAQVLLHAQRAQNAMPRRSQQDEQLDMAYRNGLEDGEALGRAEMLRTVGKVCTVVLGVGILAAFIILGVMS